MVEGVLPSTNEGIGAMTKLEQIYAEKGKKLDEICALLARELGCGEFATMRAEERKYVELEAGSALKSGERRLNSELAPTFGPSRLYGDF